MPNLKDEMAPNGLKRKPRLSNSVTDADGTIRLGGVEVTEDELQGDMNRIETMMQRNRAAMEKAKSPDLRETMRKFSDLAIEGQRETYNEGNEILRNRRLKRDPLHKGNK